MTESPVQTSRHRAKRNNLLVGLVVIALISAFGIAGKFVAYRQTVMASRLMREPPGLPSGTLSKEEGSIQAAREAIRESLAIEAVVFLTALGCFWELKRLNKSKSGADVDVAAGSRQACIDFCQFCGRSKESVRKLILSEHSAICDYCIGLCFRVLQEEGVDMSKFSTGNKG